MTRLLQARHIRLALLAATSILVTAPLGCSFGNTKVRTRNYYTVTYPLSTVPVIEDGPRHEASLRIKEFDVDLAYDRQQVVYRYSPYQLEFYNYHSWIAKPHKMLSELVFKHLKHVELFRVVTSNLRDGVPDYELEGLVRAIEEFDSDTEWFAHLAISLRLVERRGGRVVWTYAFDERKKVFNHSVIYVTRALSEIFEEQMARVVAEIAALHLRDAEAPASAPGEAP